MPLSIPGAKASQLVMDPRARTMSLDSESAPLGETGVSHASVLHWPRLSREAKPPFKLACG